MGGRGSPPLGDCRVICRGSGRGCGGERRAGRGDRSHAVRGGALSGLGTGRQLRRALAQVARRGMGRRSGGHRHLRQLEWRPHRPAAGLTPARSALQRDLPAVRAEPRRDRRLGRGTLADPNKLGAVAAFWTIGCVVFARRLPKPWPTPLAVIAIVLGIAAVWVSGSRTGMVCNSSPLTAVKSAVVAPMPIASDSKTTRVQPFDCISIRYACLRSCSMGLS